MTSLVIALPGGGGGPQNANGTPPVAPRCRRRSGECAFPLLGIGVQAIQLSPYHAGLAGQHLWRLPASPASRACSFPLWLSPSGEPDGPETFLRVPPGCARDSAPRSAAHRIRAYGSSTSRFAARKGPRSYSIELRGHGLEPRCVPHGSLDRVCWLTLRFPPQGPPG